MCAWKCTLVFCIFPTRKLVGHRAEGIRIFESLLSLWPLERLLENVSFVLRKFAPKYLQNSRMCWLPERVASVQSLSVINLELFLESLVERGYQTLPVFATCLGIHLQGRATARLFFESLKYLCG